ncbi:MAG: sensor domain-containing protein [Acidimicrobiia bacterium]
MFFDVIVKPQTWRNVAYLLLAFPLGIFYFVFLVTGLSLGLGLFITLLGIPVLVGVLASAYGLGDFERVTTNLLLDQDTQPSHRLAVSGGLWEKVKALVRSSETWKRVWYLFVEFPFGIIGFTLVTTTAAVFAMVATPLFYTTSWWPSALEWPGEYWVIDTLGEALLLSLGALVVGFVLLHLTNAVAKIWGFFAEAMLGPSDHPFAPPAPTEIPTQEPLQ